MPQQYKVLAISGSTRKQSSNSNLIHAIAALSEGLFKMDIYEGLSELPHFNPDEDHDQVDARVTDFRNQINAADAVLICTPEYAIGVPGSLKNAIDWTVSSMNFSKKPVALITASLSGAKAHESLKGTLLIIESRMTADTALLIPHIKTKVNEQGITDKATLVKVEQLITSLQDIISHVNDIENLTAPLLLHDGVNSGS